MKNITGYWQGTISYRLGNFFDYLISDSILAQSILALIQATLFAAPGWYLLASGHPVVGGALLVVTFFISLVILSTLGVWRSTIPFIVLGIWTRLMLVVLIQIFGKL